MRERLLFIWVASLAGAFLGGYFLNGRVPRYEALVSASRIPADIVTDLPHPTLAYLSSRGQPSVVIHDSSPAGAAEAGSIKLARQAAFEQELMQALENAPECGGVGFIADKERAGEADFFLRVDVYDHGVGAGADAWGWMLYDRRASRDLVGMGNAILPETVARDICRNLWRQASPRHFEHPGIRSE